MNNLLSKILVVAALLLFFAGCAGKNASMVINKGSVEPGGIVQKGETKLPLVGTPLKVGMNLPDVTLTDSLTMESFNFSQLKGKVVLLSIVPSIDTKVCEEQTHYLAEEGDRLPSNIARVMISRDTPFAQKRFAEEANLTDIQYLTDHKDASFGKATGLLIEKNGLLARSVLVVDRSGTVRYIQVVPQLGELPDMETAFAKAIELAN